jgi:hypothetical protein
MSMTQLPSSDIELADTIYSFASQSDDAPCFVARASGLYKSEDMAKVGNWYMGL